MINRRINVHEQNSEAIEAIMTQAVMKQTYDNITTVMVSFSGFKAMYTGEKEEEDRQELSYYVPLENKLKAQRSASNPRTKIGLNPKETNEENNTSRNNSNNVNENVSMSKYQKKLNISLAYALQNHKISLGSNQLIKAYKKQNLLPLPK